MTYTFISDIPEQGRKLIEELVCKGVIATNNEKINLEETVYEVLVILAKLGKI